MADYNSAYTGAQIDAAIAKANNAPTKTEAQGYANEAQTKANNYTNEKVKGYLPLSGGTLTGNLDGQYFTGTWLQTKSATDLGAKPSKIAVLDSSGWIYYRTASELLGDIGAQSKLTGTAGQVVGFDSSGKAVPKAAPSPSAENVPVPNATATALGLTDKTVNGALAKMAKAAFVSSVPTTYGDLPVGSSVFLKENGVDVEFIVIYQGNPNSSIYDASCDGTWVLRKDCSTSMAMSTSNINDYKSSSVHSYLTKSFRWRASITAGIRMSSLRSILKMQWLKKCASITRALLKSRGSITRASPLNWQTVPAEAAEAQAATLRP